MRHFVIAVACASALAAATGVAQAQTEPLDGFTPGHATKQRDYEARFQQGVSADDLGNLNRGISRVPHLDGSPNQLKVMQSVLNKMRGYGLDAHLQPYDIYL